MTARARRIAGNQHRLEVKLLVGSRNGCRQRLQPCQSSSADLSQERPHSNTVTKLSHTTTRHSVGTGKRAYRTVLQIRLYVPTEDTVRRNGGG